jgi:hypothetical protein
MDIGVGCSWEIKVDDVLDERDIETSSSDVRSDQNSILGRFESGCQY